MVMTLLTFKNIFFHWTNVDKTEYLKCLTLKKGFL